MYGVGLGVDMGLELVFLWSTIHSIFFDTLRKEGYEAILEGSFRNIDFISAEYWFANYTGLLQTSVEKVDYWDIAKIYKQMSNYGENVLNVVIVFSSG